MSLSSFLRYSLLVCFTCALTACQQAQDPPQSTAAPSTIQGSQAAAYEEPLHRLIGEWQGELEVDQEAVTELFQREGQEDELENAKASVLRSFPANFERPGAIMGQVLQMVQFGLPDDYLQTVRSNVESVTLDDVHRITQELIRPDQLKILVVGDRQQIEAGLRELDLPIVILDVDGVETT